MPKASVDEHDCRVLGKDQVGFPRKIVPMQSKAQPQPVRGLSDANLWRGVL